MKAEIAHGIPRRWTPKKLILFLDSEAEARLLRAYFSLEVCDVLSSGLVVNQDIEACERLDREDDRPDIVLHSLLTKLLPQENSHE